MSDRDQRSPEEKEKSRLRQDAYEATERLQGSLKSHARSLWPGLCGRCSHLELMVSQSEVKLAKCGEFRRDLDSRDPIVECTGYWPRGHPTYNELIDRAKIIWLPDHKKGEPGTGVYL